MAHGTAAAREPVRPRDIGADVRMTGGPIGRGVATRDGNAADLDGALIAFYREAIAGSTPGNILRLHLPPPTAENVRIVAEKTGVDLAGFRRSFDQTFARHIERRHGSGSLHARESGHPTLAQDLIRYREIVTRPDRVWVSRQRTGLDALVYEMSTGGGEPIFWYDVEEIHTGRKVLAFKSLYCSPTQQFRSV